MQQITQLVKKVNPKDIKNLLWIYLSPSNTDTTYHRKCKKNDWTPEEVAKIKEYLLNFSNEINAVLNSTNQSINL